jgi:hypothetical protein
VHAIGDLQAGLATDVGLQRPGVEQRAGARAQRARQAAQVGYVAAKVIGRIVITLLGTMD